jgi:hypothetical protein
MESLGGATEPIDEGAERDRADTFGPDQPQAGEPLSIVEGSLG